MPVSKARAIQLLQPGVVCRHGREGEQGLSANIKLASPKGLLKLITQACTQHVQNPLALYMVAGNNLHNFWAGFLLLRLCSQTDGGSVMHPTSTCAI